MEVNEGIVRSCGKEKFKVRGLWCGNSGIGHVNGLKFWKAAGANYLLHFPATSWRHLRASWQVRLPSVTRNPPVARLYNTKLIFVPSGFLDFCD